MRSSTRRSGGSVLPAAFAALFAAVALPACCQVAPPAPLLLPTPLTLPEAITLALRQQPQQYLARTQVTQAQGQKLQAQSQYFPTLTPSYQYQNNKQNLYGLNSGGTSTITDCRDGSGNRDDNHWNDRDSRNDDKRFQPRQRSQHRARRRAECRPQPDPL